MGRSIDELYEEFRRHYEWETVPLREMRNGSELAASELARALITTAFVLNGGGLVALPAFLEIFGANRLVIAVFVALVLGIVLATLGGLCAFFAFANSADGHREMINAAGHRSWATIYSNSAALASDEPQGQGLRAVAAKEHNKAAQYEAAAEPFFNNYRWYRRRGIITVIGSFACLVTGALLGILAVW